MLLISSCKKDDSNPAGNNTETQDPSITSISGKIKNWTLGSGYKLELGWRPDVYSSATIGSDGSFTLTTLTTVPSNELISSFPGATSSNPTTKTTGYYFLLVFTPDSQSNDLATGRIMYQNSNSAEAYIFSNQSTTFTGNYIEGTTPLNCDFTLKPGWNRITFSKSNTITNSVVAGGEWIYYDEP